MDFDFHFGEVGLRKRELILSVGVFRPGLGGGGVGVHQVLQRGAVLPVAGVLEGSSGQHNDGQKRGH